MGKNNKKILILANNSGGLFRFRKELIAKMISKGCKVYASTPYDDYVNDLKAIGVTLIKTRINRRGMNPIKDFKLLLDYFRIILNIKPDLIITYTIKPNLYGGTVSRIMRIPYAINITGLGSAFQKENLIRKMIVKWYKVICRNVKVVFFENEGNKNYFNQLNIVGHEKCCVLHGAGVNLKDFYFSDYPFSDNLIHFLFIGRIMKEKGIDELFWAIKKIYEENKKVILDVVGGYEDNYKDKIQELEDLGCVKYHGYQSDVRFFIKESHCFVLPSYHEGMANTLLECGAMGRPLITSNIYGCKEAVCNNKNGYLVEIMNKEDLLEKMITFINLTHEKKKMMGKYSRTYIEKGFDKTQVVEKTIKEIF